MKRFAWTLSAIVLLVLIVGCSADPVLPTQPSLEELEGTYEEPGVSRMIYSPSIAATSIPGRYLSWGVASNAVPPTRTADDPLYPGREIFGIDCLTYLGSGGDVGVGSPVWETAGVANIDWSAYDDCMNAADNYQVKLPDGSEVDAPVSLTIPPSIMDTGARYALTGGHGVVGSSTNPYSRLHLPSWMTSSGAWTEPSDYFVKYQISSGNYYQAPRYDSAFKTAMLDFIEAAGARYNSDSRVSVVRVYVGFEGENQPVKAAGGDAQALVVAGLESTVTCAEYKAWVKEAAETAYSAFPDKPVVVLTGVEPCSTQTGQSFRREIFTDWHNRGLLIGSSINSLRPDNIDFDEPDGYVYADWRLASTGAKVSSWNMPVVFETGEVPGAPASAGENYYQWNYWSLLTAVGVDTDFALFGNGWQNYHDAYQRELVDYWMNSTNRAWAVFRDAERPAITYSSGFGASGLQDDFTKYLTVLNPDTAPQACRPGVKATADAASVLYAGSSPVDVCPELLPTPQSTALAISRDFDRQARRVNSTDGPLVLSVNSDWTYYSPATTQNVTVTVSYLDAGTGTFAVVMPTLSGSVEHEITLANSKLWKRDTWNQDVAIGNLLTTGWGSAVVSIDPKTTTVYVHELFFDVDDSGTVPPTPTPTRTSTPLPTATPVADSIIVAGYMSTPPVEDGDLAEWKASDLQLKTLTYENSAYTVGQVPSLSDLSGKLWAAWDATNLYLASETTDDVIYYSDPYIWWNNDVMRFGLTGAADETVMAWRVNPAGKLADDATIWIAPASMTISSTFGTTWYRSEVSIPLASFVSPPSGGDSVRFAWKIGDNDNGGAYDTELMRWTGLGASGQVQAFDNGWAYLLLSEEPYQWDASWTPTPMPATATPTGVWSSPTPTRTATPTSTSYYVGPTRTSTSTPQLTPTPTGTWQVLPTSTPTPIWIDVAESANVLELEPDTTHPNPTYLLVNWINADPDTFALARLSYGAYTDADYATATLVIYADASGIYPVNLHICNADNVWSGSTVTWNTYTAACGAGSVDVWITGAGTYEVDVTSIVSAQIFDNTGFQLR